MDTPLRHTQQRQVILRTVKFASGPVSAVAVLSRVRKIFPGISKATLYRNLESLAKAGEISEVPTDDATMHYVGSEWHDATFRCQRCGKTRHLTSRTLPRYVDRKMFGDQMIFTSSLRATGLCASCRRLLAR